MIKSSSIVTFPGGSVNEQSTIIHFSDMPNDPTKLIIFTEKTPFHPVDNNWPDQPSDKGFLIINNKKVPIENCIMAAYNPEDKSLFLDKEIPVKRFDDKWFFLVAHIIDKKYISSNDLIIGEVITLKVDEDYRNKLSKTHALCHLAALALNKVTNNYWKKEFKKDSLGNNHLDLLAIKESSMSENNSLDRYRLGKSVKKNGFDVSSFFNDLSLIEKKINEQIIEWLSNDVNISITPKVSYINEIRQWTCSLPDGEAEIPCGGTHTKSVSRKDFDKVTIINEFPEFIMQTFTN